MRVLSAAFIAVLMWFGNAQAQVTAGPGTLKSGRIFGATTIAQATTNYIAPGVVAPNAGVGPAGIEPNAGVLRNLRVGVVTGPAVGQTFAFTVMVESAYGAGASASSVTCTISNPAVTCSDLTNTAAIAAGGGWALRVVTSATSGSTGVISASVEFDQ